MKTTYKISLTCKEATTASAMREEGKLSWSMAIRLFMHYISCPPCRRFIKQLKRISKRIRLYYTTTAEKPLHQLSPEKKQHFQDQIDKFKG